MRHARNCCRKGPESGPQSGPRSGLHRQAPRKTPVVVSAIVYCGRDDTGPAAKAAEAARWLRESYAHITSPDESGPRTGRPESLLVEQGSHQPARLTLTING